MYSQQQEQHSSLKRRVIRQDDYDSYTFGMPQQRLLATTRTCDKLAEIVSQYDQNITNIWDKICRKAGSILICSDLSLKDTISGKEVIVAWSNQPTLIRMEFIRILEHSFPILQSAQHSWVSEHLLRIKCETLRNNERTVARKSMPNPSFPQVSKTSRHSLDVIADNITVDHPQIIDANNDTSSLTSPGEPSFSQRTGNYVSREYHGIGSRNFVQPNNASSLIAPQVDIHAVVAASEAKMEAKIDAIFALFTAHKNAPAQTMPSSSTPPPQPTLKLSQPPKILEQRPRRESRRPHSHKEDVSRQLAEKSGSREQEKKGREDSNKAWVLGDEVTADILQEFNNMGRGNSGRGDSGRGDSGKGDSGRGDSGRGDSGRGDSGKGDSGRGDSGRGDSGKGDSGNDDFNKETGIGEAKDMIDESFDIDTDEELPPVSKVPKTVSCRDCGGRMRKTAAKRGPSSTFVRGRKKTL